MSLIQLDFQLMIEALPYLLEGLVYTIGIGFSSFIIGNVLGVILAVLSLSHFPSVVRNIARCYISFLRGFPALVLLFLIYFGLPYQLNAIISAVLCFSLTCSAFSAEIYRGAIEGISRYQWEASSALGFTFFQSVYYIIFPQAFRLAIPSLGNLAMDLIKGTSLSAMITVPDMFQKAKIVGGRTFDYMSMYILVGFLYWLLCVAIGYFQKRLENKMKKNMR